MHTRNAENMGTRTARSSVIEFQRQAAGGWEIIMPSGKIIYPEKYVVTGVDVYGKRFQRTFGKDGLHWALGVNLYRGSVWAVYSGSRNLIKRAYN